MNYLYRISFITFFAGMVLFAYRNQWIIIRSPWIRMQTAAVSVQEAHKKKVKIWRYQQGLPIFEQQHMLWDEKNIAINASRLVNAYLSLLYEENMLDKKIEVQAVTVNPTGTELGINFSHNIFQEEQSIHTKWMLIEGLLQTIREQIPAIKSVNLLVNHHPLPDHHLDFSHAWPIEGFLTVAEPHLSTAVHKKETRTLTIMLEPAGDAHYTGRIIEDAFERGISLQCAQELKKVLESTCKNSRIILSRFPGETLEPLQNAAFANRLKTDVYITLSMYPLPLSRAKNDPLTEINLYYFLYHPATDFWQRATATLSCEPYHQAHIPHSRTSQLLAHTLFKNLQNTKPLAGKLTHCGGLPVKPLIGVAAPALIIELGLAHKNAWQALVVQLAQQICDLLPLI